MGRLVLLAAATVLVVAFANNGFQAPEGLDGKLWLVAIFPAVYILGLALLRD